MFNLQVTYLFGKNFFPTLLGYSPLISGKLNPLCGGYPFDSRYTFSIILLKNSSYTNFPMFVFPVSIKPTTFTCSNNGNALHFVIFLQILLTTIFFYQLAGSVIKNLVIHISFMS